MNSFTNKIIESMEYTNKIIEIMQYWQPLGPTHKAGWEDKRDLVKKQFACPPEIETLLTFVRAGDGKTSNNTVKRVFKREKKRPYYCASKILTCYAPGTDMAGVILPQSNRVLFRADIDAKIEKIKNHISHLSNALACRNTNGGKRHRARQISLRNQIDYFSKRLTLLTSAREKIVKRTRPIVARKNSAIFEVLCEGTRKKWLSSEDSTHWYSDEKTKKEMRETLKKVEYQFHKVREKNGRLRITSPIGFWLRDGSLVSPDYQEGERVKAYYGTESEILSMHRRLFFSCPQEDPNIYLTRRVERTCRPIDWYLSIVGEK